METGIENVNYFAGVVFSHVANAALPSAVAIALASLLAWHKGWNAASRYCGWWLMLGLLAVLPFVPSADFHSASPMGASATAHLLPVSLALSSSAATADPIQRRIFPSPVAVFLFCWMAAACLQSVRVLQGFVRGMQMKRRSFPAPAEVEALFQDLLERAGVRRAVTLRVSDSLESPALLGYLRPQVLLPTALIAHLQRWELEQILLHELAHVQRRDDWTIVLQRAVEALAIFHPLVAYLAHRMNVDREMACDDCVMALCEARDYAACLTRVAEIRHFGAASPMAVPLLFERKSELFARVESLLDRTRAHRPGVSIVRLSLVLACAATVGVAGAFTPRFLAVPAVPEAAVELPATPVIEPQEATAPPAAPVQKEPAAKANRAVTNRGITSMAVTGEDGSTSNWGWSAEEQKGEPGTITFSSGGKRYVIRDPATMSEAAKLLRPMEELGKQQSLLGEQQAKLGAQQAALGARQAAMATAPLDAAAMNQLREQLRELESRMQQIDLEKEMKTAEEAMSKLGDLQAKIGEMQARMGSAQGLRGEEQGRLGEEQGKLGAEQGWLGAMQRKLGAEQARESERAKKQLEELVRQAQQRGLAQPLR